MKEGNHFYTGFLQGHSKCSMCFFESFAKNCIVWLLHLKLREVWDLLGFEFRLVCLCKTKQNTNVSDDANVGTI